MPTVRDIGVEGNRRIQAPAILNRVQTKIGDPFAPAALRDDVRSIFALGFFDDVQLRTEEFEGGIRVIFVVVERPLSARSASRGTPSSRRTSSARRPPFASASFSNPVEVQRAQEAIREKYEDEGFFGVQITPRTSGRRRAICGSCSGPGGPEAPHRPDRHRGQQGALREPDQRLDADRERLYWIFPSRPCSAGSSTTTSSASCSSTVPRVPRGTLESHEIIPDLDRKKVTLRIRVVEAAVPDGHHHDHRERAPLDRGGGAAW